MAIRKRWRLWTGCLGGILLLAALWGCHSSSSSTQSQNCVQPGRYRYYKMTDLSLSACTFPNGAQTLIEQGVTDVVASAEGYTFVAGEEGRWSFTLSCRGEANFADVSIVLNNKCPGESTVLTRATSTAEMDTLSWGAGSIYIYEYALLWTCGGDEGCLAKEAWGLIPE